MSRLWWVGWSNFGYFRGRDRLEAARRGHPIGDVVGEINGKAWAQKPLL